MNVLEELVKELQSVLANWQRTADNRKAEQLLRDFVAALIDAEDRLSGPTILS